MLDSLLQQFDVIADAPDASERLRDMILQLAVRGKLVPQHSDEESSHALLDRITHCEVPHAHASSATAAADVPYPVPETWCWVRLGAIADQRLGKMLDKAKNKGTPYPYLRNTNVQWLRFDLRDVKEMRFESGELDEYEVRPGDLLVCEGGEPGRGAVWPGGTGRMMFQKALHRVRPHDGVSAWYLLYALQAAARDGRLAAYFTGATIKHLTGQALERFVLPLPPAAEQVRIATKVDELMALCDELEKRQQRRIEARDLAIRAVLQQLTAATDDTGLATAWEQLHQSFDSLFDAPQTIPSVREAVLQLAVRGRLVPFDATSCQCALADLLAEPSLNGLASKPHERPEGTPILRISAGTSRRDALVDEDDHRFLDLGPAELQRFRLHPGDLLACRFNGNLRYVGRMSLYSGMRGVAQVYPDKLIRFRVARDRAMPEYVRYAFNSADTRLLIERHCATTAGNIGVSAGRLKTIEIPVPDLDIQQQVVARVNELMGICDRLEAQLTHARDRSSHLAAAMVHRLTAA